MRHIETKETMNDVEDRNHINYIKRLTYNRLNDLMEFSIDYGDALNFLNAFEHTKYDNISTSDLTDYEKLIYIELKWPNDEIIKEKLLDIKNKINRNYIIKNKVLKRLG